MSAEIRPLSRRRLLQIASMAPAIALAQQGASRAEVLAAIPPDKKIPDDPDMKELKKKAKKANPQYDPSFELVANMLWGYFKAGAEPVGFDNEAKVLQASFDYTSGFLISHRLGRFDPNGNDTKTNGCAFTCGSHAAALALDSSSGEITEEIYKEAWRRTEKQMGPLLIRARSIAALAGEPGQISILGHGC